MARHHDCSSGMLQKLFFIASEREPKHNGPLLNAIDLPVYAVAQHTIRYGLSSRADNRRRHDPAPLPSELSSWSWRLLPGWRSCHKRCWLVVLQERQLALPAAPLSSHQRPRRHKHSVYRQYSVARTTAEAAPLTAA